MWAVIMALCFNVGVYGHFEPSKGCIRIFIGCMLVYGMHFAAGEVSFEIESFRMRMERKLILSFLIEAYQSFLLSVLTTPRFDYQVSFDA